MLSGRVINDFERICKEVVMP